MLKDNENVKLELKELLNAHEYLQTEYSNEHIAAAMLLIASTSAELSRLNRLEEEALNSSDSALQDKYDKEFNEFNATITFKSHTVQVSLGSMDAYDAFIRFLVDYANNEELYK